MEDLSVQMGEMRQEIKDITRRLDNLEKLTESVYDLATSVKVLTERQSTTDDNVQKIAEDVDELKNKPAKRWESLVAALIAGVVGAIIGHFIK